MKKSVALITVFFLSLPSTPVGAEEGPSWKINEDQKLQLVYLPSDGSRSSEITLYPALANRPPYAPDIDNIAYRDLLELGFPLPIRPSALGLKFYLKLFAWPKGAIDSQWSVHSILSDFRLWDLPGVDKVAAFAADPAHVLIKFALIDKAGRSFSAEKPFPSKMSRSPVEFSSSLPFSSLYLEPLKTKVFREERARARASAEGVLSFHKQLKALYARTLLSLPRSKKGKTDVFAAPQRCTDDNVKICALRVYEMSENPLVFENFAELPMPQDPKNVFLSGLLLIKVTDYAAKIPENREALFSKPEAPGDGGFDGRFQALGSHLLEVASVYDRRRK